MRSWVHDGLRGLGWAKRLLVAVATGWVAGYVSWQPLRMCAGRPSSWSTWPFDGPTSAWVHGPAADIRAGGMPLLPGASSLDARHESRCVESDRRKRRPGRSDHSGGGWRLDPGISACSTAPSGEAQSVLHGGALPRRQCRGPGEQDGAASSHVDASVIKELGLSGFGLSVIPITSPAAAMQTPPSVTGCTTRSPFIPRHPSSTVRLQ